MLVLVWKMRHLLFTDDMALMADSIEKLQKLVSEPWRV